MVKLLTYFSKMVIFENERPRTLQCFPNQPKRKEDERKELMKDVSPLRAYRGDSPDTVVSAYFNASSSDGEKRDESVAN